MTYEEMKSLMLEVLPESGQITDLIALVGRSLQQRKVQVQAPPQSQYGVRQVIRYDPNFDQSGLSHQDRGQINSLYWDLVVERVIRVGLGDGVNNNPPFFHQTDFYKDSRKKFPGKVNPYDQEGYLRRIAAIAPKVDDVTLEYLTEALETFRVGCLRSTSITLGCAAERVLLNLMESLTAGLTAAQMTSEAEKLKATENKPIMQRVKPFNDLMTNKVRPKLRLVDKSLEDDLTLTLDGISHNIRRSRNSAGHPVGIEVDRDVVYSQMMIFITYVQTVQTLVHWLSKDPCPLV